MSTPSSFSEEEWRELSERRRDHLRRSVAATRIATGARNERDRLARQLSELEDQQGSGISIDPALDEKKTALQRQYKEARKNAECADDEVRSLARLASEIEYDMNGSVGIVGLLLPVFSSP